MNTIDSETKDDHGRQEGPLKSRPPDPVDVPLPPSPEPEPMQVGAPPPPEANRRGKIRQRVEVGRGNLTLDPPKAKRVRPTPKDVPNLGHTVTDFGAQSEVSSVSGGNNAAPLAPPTSTEGPDLSSTRTRDPLPADRPEAVRVGPSPDVKPVAAPASTVTDGVTGSRVVKKKGRRKTRNLRKPAGVNDPTTAPAPAETIIASANLAVPLTTDTQTDTPANRAIQALETHAQGQMDLSGTTLGKRRAETELASTRLNQKTKPTPPPPNPFPQPPLRRAKIVVV
jgi:hypothetical protein